MEKKVNNYSAMIQDKLGFMEIKFKILDLIIGLSEKNGYLTTETLMELRKKLDEQHNKELILEKMEKEDES